MIHEAKAIRIAAEMDLAHRKLHNPLKPDKCLYCQFLVMMDKLDEKEKCKPSN